MTALRGIPGPRPRGPTPGDATAVPKRNYSFPGDTIESTMPSTCPWTADV